MPQFIFAYHGGKKPESEAAMAEVMAKWNAWIEKYKTELVNPGNPAGPSKTVSSKGVTDDGGANPLSGFSIVETKTMDDAIKVAKDCPILDEGTVEIAELMAM